MDDVMKEQLLAIMDAHRIMTVATLRADGWPQATTVGYARMKGLRSISCAASIARRPKISLVTRACRSRSTMTRRK